MNNAYKASGVDVEAGYRSNELIKKHVARTMRSEVLSGIGGFGGLFSLSAVKNMDDPVAVAGTDGVGTKLKLAFIADKHDTIGVDAVAMCVNDIVCCGAEPLFFLDYIACGKNVPERIEQIVKGVSDGCEQSGCSLIGGETAEMPDFYPVDEYDLAGFAVGVVDRKNIIDGSAIKVGDTLIGIASSGLHSNGFSLVRKVLQPTKDNVGKHIDELGCTLGEELLRPTKLYVKSILELIKQVKVKGISNITGGGFIENMPRMLPEGTGITVSKGTWEVLPVFKLIQSLGNIPENEMYNTFNMGIGMALVTAPEDAEQAVSVLISLGEKASIIGEITSVEGVTIC